MTIETRIKLFDAYIGDMIPKNLRRYLLENGFFSAPASTKFHGCYEGGLFDHSLAVTRRLVQLTERNGLKWENQRSPILVGMFHDLCKIDTYIHPLVSGTADAVDTSKWVYNKNTEHHGHGDKSVLLLSEFISLTEEERLCIRYHMGAFSSQKEWPEYTAAVKKYETVLWTHQADMLASQIDCI